MWLLLVKGSETVACLEEEVGLSTGRRCSLKRSPFCLSYVLFVTASTLYHLNKIF